MVFAQMPGHAPMCVSKVVEVGKACALLDAGSLMVTNPLFFAGVNHVFGWVLAFERFQRCVPGVFPRAKRGVVGW